MSIKRFLLTFFSFILFSSVIYADVWPVNNSWNSSWEKKYETWISESVKEDFFIKGKIATDCADSVIALRTIFARDNQLPIAFHLSDGSVLTQASEKKENSPDAKKNWSDDRQFVKYLIFLLKNTSSSSLIKDAYPISLSSHSIRPGVFFIHDYVESRHVDIVHKIDWSGRTLPLTMLSSTVPAEIRELTSYPFYFTSFPIKNKSGFMRFRWPNQTQTDFFSNEQYDLENQYAKQSFDSVVAKRILGFPLKADVKIHQLFSSLIEKLNSRIKIVEAGHQHCHIDECQKGSSSYYNYSTPARDGNIGYMIFLIEEIVNNEGFGEDSSTISLIHQEYLASEIRITADRSLSLRDVISVWKDNQYSSNPNDAIHIRWGF